ncbi:exo-alpha-sialidase [candidate division KSB1 bacterium]|nr:exo-alpha-sialidase [candidate division KSB1 bacterium]
MNRGMIWLCFGIGLMALVCATESNGNNKISMENIIIAQEESKFHGWPANNGVWAWNDGQEILVGFSYGRFVEQKGHNIEGRSEDAEGILSRLARSTDGGRTWTVEDPTNYVGDGVDPTPSPGNIDFESPGFAMRVVGIGYHGARDPQGSFFVSADRGKTWRGPFRFNGLMADNNLKDMDCTSRTGYLVTGQNSCLIMMSARPKVNGGGRDKSFVAETIDGGKTFHFVSWIVPLDDPYRAVMPSVVKQHDGSLVAALRRRVIGQDSCWVDAYTSTDNGRTWSFLSRVGETGDRNGNPPALVALKDGRLACAYGDRARVKLYARLSADGGKTWNEEIILREDFQPDQFGDKDFGYPRLVQNQKGELVVMYYWATKVQPQHYFAATIWTIQK